MTSKKIKFKEDLSAINPLFIDAKYDSIEDINKWALNQPLEYRNAAKKIKEKYETGDEIWHYSEYIDEVIAGGQKELFLLIRDNKIICSPLIKRSLKCIFN
jgi:hypothetical protein